MEKLGYWENPESVILGWDSYAKINADTIAQHFIKTMRTHYTPVFIGCGGGLEDPNVGKLFHWAAEHATGLESCIYLIEKHEKVEEIRKRYPVTKRFVVLDYGNEYNELGPFLKMLLNTEKLIRIIIFQLPC